jgi:hypothetical protein
VFLAPSIREAEAGSGFPFRGVALALAEGASGECFQAITCRSYMRKRVSAQDRLKTEVVKLEAEVISLERQVLEHAETIGSLEQKLREAQKREERISLGDDDRKRDEFDYDRLSKRIRHSQRGTQWRELRNRLLADLGILLSLESRDGLQFDYSGPGSRHIPRLSIPDLPSIRDLHHELDADPRLAEAWKERTDRFLEAREE